MGRCPVAVVLVNDLLPVLHVTDLLPVLHVTDLLPVLHVPRSSDMMTLPVVRCVIMSCYAIYTRESSTLVTSEFQKRFN